MKKLEKLGSKLFDAFRGDEVSELASVVGGTVYSKTTDGQGCEDTLKSANNEDRRRGNQSEESLDIIHSTLSEDRGGVAYQGGSTLSFAGMSGGATMVAGGASSGSFSVNSSFLSLLQ